LADRPAVQVLGKLIELQEIDTQLDAAGAIRAEFPAQRKIAGERAEAAGCALSVARQAVEDQELEQRRVEGKLKDAEALILRLEGQTGNVSSNQAYTALLREIDQARAQASECEDEILGLMERVDKAHTEAAAAEAELRSVEAQVAADEAERCKREDQLGHELERLSEQRHARSADIDSKALRQYDQIGRRHPVRIATLVKKACGGCRIVIPAQRASEVRAATELVTCLQCDRILVTESLLAEIHAASQAGQ